MALVSSPRKAGAPAFPLALPEDRPLGVLFVCMGNICRSPLAEGAFRAAVAAAGLGDRLRIDSAGLTDFHEDEPPDPRAVAVAAARGLDISGLRARAVRPTDFLDFDVMLAMDRQNLSGLEARRPDHALARAALLLEAAEGRNEPIPDPYYGSKADFEAVFDTVERATARLVERLRGQT